MLGYEAQSIKQLTKKQFEDFLVKKQQFQAQILKHYPVIVTTVGNATTKAIRDLKFTKVVIDEATQVKE